MFPGKIRQLDGKELFELYRELGTVPKVRAYLTKHNRINEYTGQPFSIPGIHLAMNRYIIYHPDEVRPLYQKQYRFLDGVGDESWKGFLIRKARRAVSTRQQFEEWLEWSGLKDFYEQYKEMLV